MLKILVNGISFLINLIYWSSEYSSNSIPLFFILLFIDFSNKSFLNSQPMPILSLRLATMEVVKLPANGSNTISPSCDAISINLVKSSRGFWVGCAALPCLPFNLSFP